VKFYEKPRPHVMYHADTMEVTLVNESVIYQISVEDDYSRGYMALCVFPTKHSYFVVLTLGFQDTQQARIIPSRQRWRVRYWSHFSVTSDARHRGCPNRGRESKVKWKEGSIWKNRLIGIERRRSKTIDR
jgi:hypothetical protein